MLLAHELHLGLWRCQILYLLWLVFFVLYELKNPWEEFFGYIFSYLGPRLNKYGRNILSKGGKGKLRLYWLIPFDKLLSLQERETANCFDLGWNGWVIRKWVITLCWYNSRPHCRFTPNWDYTMPSVQAWECYSQWGNVSRTGW